MSITIIHVSDLYYGVFGLPSSPTAFIGSGSGDLLYATVRAYDLWWPVGVNHHHAVPIQQSPALAASKLIEKPNTRLGVRLPP